METESTAQTLDDRRASGVVTVLVGLAVAILTIVFVLETNVFTSHWYALFKSLHVAGAVVWVGGGWIAAWQSWF